MIGEERGEKDGRGVEKEGSRRVREGREKDTSVERREGRRRRGEREGG